jgi:hypothetical protein
MPLTPFPIVRVGCFALAFASACSPAARQRDGDRKDVEPQPTAVWSPRLPPRHAAFVEVPARQLRVPALSPAGLTTAGAARLSYRFVPADRSNAPLCIVSSGGPGVTSTMMQRSLGVSAEASGRLASVCHVLFIDQRNTGFSYNLGRSEQPEGTARFSLGDNNPYTDAGDFLWVTLDLMERYPDLFELPIVVLAESYGGVRATLMVDLWLHPQAYEAGQRRVIDDAVLARLGQVERDLGGSFGDRVRYQVLIQPTLAGTAQDDASGLLFEAEGSVLDTLAAEVGGTYTRCDFDGCKPYFNALNLVAEWGRSGYDYREAAGWLDRRLEMTSALLDTREGTSELLTADPESLPELGPGARTDAWRLSAPDSVAVEDDWATRVLGELNPDDRYFVPFNDSVFSAFSSDSAEQLGIDWLDPSYATLFLDNCRTVDTLLTRASYDLVNYSPGLIAALSEYDALASLELDETSADERPGVLRLHYGDGGEVRVRSPQYASGHGVISGQPEQLATDIGEWLGGFLAGSSFAP